MTSNTTDYGVLGLFAAAYLGAVYSFQSTPRSVMFATVAFSASYVLWGIFHQLRTHNFHARIVLEYLLVAILGVAIVSTLLF